MLSVDFCDCEDQCAHTPAAVDGFCTCYGPSWRMRDCGIAAHRLAAFEDHS